MSTLLPRFTEWYTINGTEFATHGYWISSITKGHAQKKGKDIDVPSIHGVAWREKRFDSRAETWNIVITDANPTTGIVATTEAGRRSQFNSNYDAVMSILTSTNQLTIAHSRINTASSGTVDVRYGYGEIIGSFTMEDHKVFTSCEFNVDVVFADPRWYDSANYSPAPVGTISTATLNTSITNSAAIIGTAPVTYMTITFAATTQDLVNPRLTNQTYSATSVIGYTGTITAGTSVVIDTEALTVKTGTGTNVISGLYRSGSRQDWMVLFPTTNTLVFSQNSTVGRGTCTIGYKRAYI
jgi:hypothetical protein